MQSVVKFAASWCHLFALSTWWCYWL